MISRSQSIVIGLLLLALSSTSAMAIYHPRMGRFMQRDPAGTPDGINRYAGYHVMHGALDPSGKVIVAGCDRATKDYFTRLGLDGLYSERKTTDIISRYTIVGEHAGPQNLESEIVYEMMRANRIFQIKDADVTQLKLHVNARSRTVQATTQAKFHFGRTSDFEQDEGRPAYNIKYWKNPYQVKKGVKPSTAISDIFNNHDSYCMGCAVGKLTVQLYGIHQAIGSEEFDKLSGYRPFDRKYTRKLLRIRQDTIWVPGDGGYVKNAIQGVQGLNSGENIIYVGGGKYWGHGMAGNKTKDEIDTWFATDEFWKNRKGESGKAEWDKRLDFPSAGLK